MEKHCVFSAGTIQTGLTALEELKIKLNVGWDEMVIDAMCGHYGLDKSVLMLPKVYEKKGANAAGRAEKVDIMLASYADKGAVEKSAKPQARVEVKPKKKKDKKASVEAVS
jgi:hypothetical protein